MDVHIHTLTCVLALVRQWNKKVKKGAYAVRVLRPGRRTRTRANVREQGGVREHVSGAARRRERTRTNTNEQMFTNCSRTKKEHRTLFFCRVRVNRSSLTFFRGHASSLFS